MKVFSASEWQPFNHAKEIVMIKKILFGLIGLIVLLVLVSFVLPSEYKVSRTRVMNAPPEKIFPYLNQPKLWKDWSAWHSRDTNMKLAYAGPDVGVGAQASWESKSEGNGAMTFTKSDANRFVEYKLTFADWGMVSTGTLKLEPQGNGTSVTWATEGQLGMNPISRYFGLVMDKMIGGDFETGLANLEKVAQK
jgi:uncharacterized protein YndB with AHSA1/START domain